jgi:hypothetical protein
VRNSALSRLVGWSGISRELRLAHSAPALMLQASLNAEGIQEALG